MYRLTSFQLIFAGHKKTHIQSEKKASPQKGSSITSACWPIVPITERASARDNGNYSNEIQRLSPCAARGAGML